MLQQYVDASSYVMVNLIFFVEDFAPAFHAYWNSMGQFYYNYSVLVINSFGLQHALDRSPVDIGHFFIRCHTSAVTCATIVRDELGPGGYLRYSPDSHFVQCSYAVLSLLKVRNNFLFKDAICSNEASSLVYETCLPPVFD